MRPDWMGRSHASVLLVLATYTYLTKWYATADWLIGNEIYSVQKQMFFSNVEWGICQVEALSTQNQFNRI